MKKVKVKIIVIRCPGYRNPKGPTQEQQKLETQKALTPEEYPEKGKWGRDIIDCSKVKK